jgi:hypothetical protein
MKIHPEHIDWDNNWLMVEFLDHPSNPTKINYWQYVSRDLVFCNRYLPIVEEYLNSFAEQAEMMTDINDALQIASGNLQFASDAGTRSFWIPPMSMLVIPTEQLDWLFLSSSPYAIHILEKHINKINWKGLCVNVHPRAMRLLEQHPEKIDWKTLSTNPSPAAIALLAQHPDKVYWYNLSANGGAERLLEKYPENVVRSRLCINQSQWAMQLLEKDTESINWFFLSLNPSMFVFNETYDYEKMKESKNRLHEDLIQTMFHPDNIHKFGNWGFLEHSFYI